MKNKQTFHLTNEETRLVERLYYIHASYQAYISILAREFANTNNPDAKSMLDKYIKEGQKSFIELRVAQDAILDNKFQNKKPENLHFTFKFDTQEVACAW